MQIKRILLTNWKNFRSANVLLQNRMFLIGPNASGKSNFLDAFRFMKDIVAPKGGGFWNAVDLRGGVSAIRCLSARRKPEITLEFHFEDLTEDKEEKWLYRLSFSQDNRSRPVIKEEVVERNGKTVLSRPDDLDKGDQARLTQTALEQINANKEFRKIASFFSSVTYQNLIPQLIRDPAGFSPGIIENDPFGRDFLVRVDAQPARIRKGRLKKIQEVLQIALPQLKELEIERDFRGAPHLVGLYGHWRPNAGRQTEAQFSDGTLRLFGLLWTLFEGDGLLLLEEPELSLHTEVVRHIPSMIERISRYRKIRRQYFISTHSESMLNDQSIDAEEVIWFEPTSEGTEIRQPIENESDLELLKSGLTIADVILPKTAPRNIEQLGLF